MSYDEDHIAMAAEYVLGTLDGEERAQVETMIAVDPEFKLVVEQWERRLGELHAMVGAVEPADEVWGKIRTAVSAIKPEAAMRLPDEPHELRQVAQCLEAFAHPTRPLDVGERRAGIGHRGGVRHMLKLIRRPAHPFVAARYGVARRNVAARTAPTCVP